LNGGQNFPQDFYVIILLGSCSVFLNHRGNLFFISS
jgi:hypothetical protein